MANQNAEKILKSIKEQGASKPVSIDRMRKDMVTFYSQFSSHFEVTTQSIHIDEIPASWIASPKASTEHTLLFFHGGGFIVGSTADHFDLCAKLSYASDCRVLSVDYRLAPEHTFPAALDDALRAYQWLINQGTSPSSVLLVGVSAGGNLALSMPAKLREYGFPQPKAAVCLSPAVDLATPGRSLTKNKDKDWITKETLDVIGTTYLRGQDPKAPGISPIFGDLKDLPPLFLQVGTHEVLYDDVLDFAEKARAAGNNVTLETWEEMFHCWQIFSSVLPEGRQAIDSIGKFVKQTLATA